MASKDREYRSMELRIEKREDGAEPSEVQDDAGSPEVLMDNDTGG